MNNFIPENPLIPAQNKDNQNIELNLLPFSFFKAPINNNIVPLNNISLQEVYNIIISDKYKEFTKILREVLEDKKKEYKEKSFDFVTFSCTVTQRRTDGIIQHSCLICADLDHVVKKTSELKELKNKIINSYRPALMFTSPSGDGLKVIYQISFTDDCTHLMYFKALEQYYSWEFQIKIDEKCKDVVRACFLCHDPEAYYSENPEILDSSFIDTFGENIADKKITEFSDTLKKKTEKKITNDALIIKNCKTWLDKKESFVNGNRNNYVSQLTAAWHRYGVSENEAKNEALRYTQDSFTTREIESIVKSIYRNSQWFGKATFDINNEYLPPMQTDIPTPLLPIDGFPAFLQDFINEYHAVYKTPRDFFAASVIISTALAIGNKLELIGKYKNVPVLWMNIIGNVSSGKTEPLSRCLRFFSDRDAISIKEYNDSLESLQIEKAKPKKEQSKNMVVPKCLQYLLNDFTPEALAAAHSVNNRGICIYRDELKGYLDDFGRYNKSGEQSNMLSSFYQQPIIL